MLVVRSEPLPLDPSVSETTPSHLNPLLEQNTGARVPYAGLIDPEAEPSPDWVVAEPGDLMTSVRGVQPSVVFGPDNQEFERVARDPRAVRLVTFPEGEEVASEIRVPAPVHGEITRRVSLVPESPLEDRWYALEVNVESSVGETLRTERTQLARFRPDSHPIATHALMVENADGFVLELRFSERVAGDVPASNWRLTDERGELECEVLGPRRGQEEHQAVFRCSRPPLGVARVDFGGQLQTVRGTPLVDARDWVVTTLDVDIPTMARDVVRRVPTFHM